MEAFCHNEMVLALKAMTGEKDDFTLSTYLKIAGNKILRKAFPFDSEQNEVPPIYSHIQLEIAAYLLNKRGADGEVSHDENGIKRVYENADVPKSMLAGVVPMVGVLK